MRSLQARFNRISMRNPFWSSYVCFADSIKGQNFSRKIIHCWFNKLIDKNDYCKEEKKQILRFLETL